MDGWLIALILTVIWLILVYFLYKKGYVKKEGNIALFGPAIMLKTARGKKYIERVGRHRIWEAYGYAGIALSFLVMILVFAMLLWQAYMVTTIPASKAPSPVEALGIPGINPVIPIWYGILGLAVAIVFHELSHGLLTAFHRMKIISLGILLFIVPIGAFVEPDEDQLMEAERIKRMHVFAAGPTTNIVLAVIFLILFSVTIGAASPSHSGVYVAGVGGVNGEKIKIGDIIAEINGTEIKSIGDFVNVNAPRPGESTAVKYYRGSLKQVELISGIFVLSVMKGYPAYDAGIRPGWIFYSINGTIIRNYADFLSALNETRAGERIPIVMLNTTLQRVYLNVTLADKYEYYEKYQPQMNRDYFKGKGFLGVGASFMGMNVGDPNLLKQTLANPYEGKSGFDGFFQGSMYLIALPFMGLMPFPAEYENIFSTPFAGFWILVNSFYWIFWLNLMLGLTNLLPAVPLDGGYLFKDLLTGIAKKMKAKKPEEVASNITTFMSILILVLIVWQFVGPRI